MDALNMSARPQFRQARQQGFVLVVTLLVMVIITLSSVAMIVAMRAGISASGNIAFRQAASRTADVGVDQAFQDTAANFTAAALAANPNGLDVDAANATYRYYATVNGVAKDTNGAVLTLAEGCTKDGSTTFSPEKYRFNSLDGNGNPIPVNDKNGNPCAIQSPSTPSGYSLFYVVHRMAEATGSCGVTSTGCSRVSVDGGTKPGCSVDAASVDYCGSTSYVYYRITVKVAGPRQNNRYIQAFVY